MKRAKLIETKLKQALAPLRIDVVDESHRHHGHASAPAGGESHFRIVVVSEAFVGKSRIDRQRMVYGLLAEELTAGVHALAMTALTPEEDAARKN